MRRSLWSIVFLLLMVGFVSSDNSKQSYRKVSNLPSLKLSTGLSSIGIDSTKAASFLSHESVQQKSVNFLYQGFLAIHYDGLDSLKTLHSSVGRTNSGAFPGDENQFQLLSSKTSRGSSDTAIQVFSLPNSQKFSITQMIIAKGDSTNQIEVRYIFDFAKRQRTDTTKFRNLKILLGYDGDIGGSSGLADDCTGYYSKNNLSVVYLFDKGLGIYSGIGLINKGPMDFAGSEALLHQTVNATGKTRGQLDQLLFDRMVAPKFSTEAQNTDASVYWVVSLGTVSPDTILNVRDSVRFIFVNGRSPEELAKTVKIYAENSLSYETPLPTTIELLPNYPNPFNPGTTIRYLLPKSEKVELSVYNILGQHVATLVNETKPAGRHFVVWDSKDSRGSSLSSGIYFYQLRTGGKVITRKMTLVR